MSRTETAYIVVPDAYDPTRLGKLLRTMAQNQDQQIEKRVKEILADPRMADQRNARGIGTRNNDVSFERSNRPAIGEQVVARNGEQAVFGGSGGAMKYEATAQNAGIAAQTLAKAIAHRAGIYRVTAYVGVTTGGGALCTVTVTIGWTDDVGATTSNLINALPATAPTRSGQHLVLYSTGAAAITATVTVGGTAGTLAYNVRVACERVL